MSDDGTHGSDGTGVRAGKWKGIKGVVKSGRERESGILEYRCRHTGARGCNALLMNTKNFIKDCLYIKLSTKLCPITPVAPSRAWKLLAAAVVLPFPSPVALMIRLAGKSHNHRGKKRTDSAPRSCSFRVFSLADSRFTRLACTRYSSSVEVSYFATFGTYIIRRDDIGSWDVARATRSKKDGYVENKRESEQGL